MLKALVFCENILSILAEVDSDGICVSALYVARAAIAKAKGGAA